MRNASVAAVVDATDTTSTPRDGPNTAPAARVSAAPGTNRSAATTYTPPKTSTPATPSPPAP